MCVFVCMHVYVCALMHMCVWVCPVLHMIAELRESSPMTVFRAKKGRATIFQGGCYLSRM